VPIAPAIGIDTIDRPGTNFATASTRTPQRPKKRSVFFTQVSRDNERRQIVFSVLPPYMRPARYQALSPISVANIDRIRTGNNCVPTEPGCMAAIAPNSTSDGIAGTGSPSEAANTFTKTSAGPYCSTRSCSIGLHPSPFRERRG
jgi:hypothetical protein